jgi:hypothetical protein
MLFSGRWGRYQRGNLRVFNSYAASILRGIVGGVVGVLRRSQFARGALKLAQFLEALADILAPAILETPTTLAVSAMQSHEFQGRAQPPSHLHKSPAESTLSS